MSAINEKFGMPKYNQELTQYYKANFGRVPKDQKVDGHFSENDKWEASKGMDALENYLSKGAVTFPKDLEALDALKAFVRNNKTPSFEKANLIYDTVADFRTRFDQKLDKTTKQSLDRILAELNYVLLHPSKEDLGKSNTLQKTTLDSYTKMLSDKKNIETSSVEISGSAKIYRVGFIDGTELKITSDGKNNLVILNRESTKSREDEDVKKNLGTALQGPMNRAIYTDTAITSRYMDNNNPQFRQMMDGISRISK